MKNYNNLLILFVEHCENTQIKKDKKLLLGKLRVYRRFIADVGQLGATLGIRVVCNIIICT